MRVGFNPHKDQLLNQSDYFHQIIIPLYIPSQDGYFKDSFKIFKLCLESLFTTIHDKTFITIVNNGSGDFVKDYLNELLDLDKIQEVIHSKNIGKLNSVLKGLSGNDIEFVTVADADTLFLNDWQSETMNIFHKISKAGVVGIVPQLNMYKYKSGNVIFDNLFNNRLQFITLTDPEGMIQFYESIGWDRNYNQDYLKLGLGLEYDSVKCFVGAGHFVATYKKDVFEEIKTYFSYKLGGTSEAYLDEAPLKKDYWRLTTQGNFAYHMGNVYEDWMQTPPKNPTEVDLSNFNFVKRKKINPVFYFLKNRIIKKLITFKWVLKLFFKWKKLPKEMVNKY
jgi:hypothetical protein